MSDEYFGDDHQFDGEHGFDAGHDYETQPDLGGDALGDADALGGHELYPDHDASDGGAASEGYDVGAAHDAGDLGHLAGAGGEHASYDPFDLPESPDGAAYDFGAEVADGFPEPLQTEVTPADGLPWTEPGLLGSGQHADEPALVDWAPQDELTAGLSPDDPAERALASYWSQGGDLG